MRNLTLLCVFFVLAGCKEKFGGPCKSTSDCAKGLECMTYEEITVCVEEGTAQCREDPGCKEKGLCTRKDGTCIAYYDYDCE